MLITLESWIHRRLLIGKIPQCIITLNTKDYECFRDNPKIDCQKFVDANYCGNYMLRKNCCKSCPSPEESVNEGLLERYGGGTCSDTPGKDCKRFVAEGYCHNIYLQRGCCSSCRGQGTGSSKHVNICGSLIEYGLIYMGVEALPSEHPWNAALYVKRKSGEMHLICGRTLVSPYAVLTAAHCIEDEDGARIKKSKLKVVMGKKHLDYDHANDKRNGLYLDVEKIHMHELYDGYIKKENDLAILQLKTMVKADMYMPACIDTENNHQLITNLTGKVVGWGKDDENGEQTEVLQETKVPYISYENCITYLSDPFHLSKDKFCSVREDLRTTALQQGDSGSGLVFEFGEKYYVYGITSTAFHKNVTTKLTTFTDIRVGVSLEFINRILKKIMNK